MFATIIEANYISKRDDKLVVSSLTDENHRRILALSKDERIADRVGKQKLSLLYLWHKRGKHCFCVLTDYC